MDTPGTDIWNLALLFTCITEKRKVEVLGYYFPVVSQLALALSCPFGCVSK